VDKKYRLKDTDTKDFWFPILTNAKFQEWVKTNYQISSGQLMTDQDIDTELGEIEDEAI